MQSQLQLEYASVESAVVLLELVEALYGHSVSSGLMLCKAWTKLNEKDKLEKKAKTLLSNPALENQQAAAIHYCLSEVRWRAKERVGARKAHASYTSSVTEESS